MKGIKKIVFISILTSLALVLDLIKKFIPFLNMPSGGSINIALIPIVMASFIIGIKESFVVGFLWFFLSSLIGLNSYFISFGQIVFDYFIPSTILCFCSLFYKRRNNFEIIAGIFLFMFLRTLSICFSGAMYWYDESTVAGSLNAWIFSLSYNLPYSIATTLMLVLVIPILFHLLVKDDKMCVKRHF